MISIVKKCSKCREEKGFVNFTKDKRNKDGMGALCLRCFAERSRELSPKHKIKKAERGKLYRESNKEKIKIRIKKWYLDNRERHTENGRIWRKENPEKAREMYKRRDQILLSTPKGRISSMVSTGINKSLRNGTKAGRHWEELVDFTIDQLKTHFEKLFTPEMTWDNYGTYWHIDHRIPLAVHNFKTPEDLDFKRAWSLINLQPLEATKNMSKGGRVEKPFQPSLAI